MTDILSKQTIQSTTSKEENLLNWNEVLKNLKKLLEAMFMKVG